MPDLRSVQCPVRVDSHWLVGGTTATFITDVAVQEGSLACFRVFHAHPRQPPEEELVNGSRTGPDQTSGVK